MSLYAGYGADLNDGCHLFQTVRIEAFPRFSVSSSKARQAVKCSMWLRSMKQAGVWHWFLCAMLLALLLGTDTVITKSARYAACTYLAKRSHQ